ncbi:MAG: glycosyltransferase [Sulfitobacter sp.]
MFHLETPISNSPEVTILMGTLNGAAHLSAQLGSLSNQTHTSWHLVASDDGSRDATLSILSDFARDHPDKVTIRSGPERGFSANYLSMMRALPARPGFVCLADQDDIWLTGKISRAVQCLSTNHHPTLYAGRRIIWQEKTGHTYHSRPISRPCTLHNALIENIAAGNTIVLNPAAAALSRQAALKSSAIFAHDWWLYLLITASGGKVVFDNGPPQVFYRQHDRNVIGANDRWSDHWRRKSGVLKGQFADRLDQNVAALKAIQNLLTPQARRTIAEFENALKKRGVKRLHALHNLALYRQQLHHTLGFWGAVSLGKI